MVEARKKGEILSKKIQVGFDPDTGQPIFEDQEYTLTDVGDDIALSYTYPPFIIEPAFCPLEYTVQTSLLENGGSAVFPFDEH